MTAPRTPRLQNVKVRQAINYAFDRKTILDQVLLGQGTPTSQPFGKASGAWTEELENYYATIRPRPRQLLKEAGYETGVTLKSPASPASRPTFRGQQQLADVGITLKWRRAHQHLHVRRRRTEVHHACTSPSSRASRVAINQIISTKALYNPFKNASRSSSKIDAVRNGGDDAGKLAQDVNKYVVEQAWFAPLFRVNQMYYHNAKVNVTPQIQQAVPSIYNYSPAK